MSVQFLSSAWGSPRWLEPCGNVRLERQQLARSGRSYANSISRLPISLESGSGRRRLAVHIRKPRHQCFGGVCEHIGAFVAAAFTWVEKAAVPSLPNVTWFLN